MVFDKKDVDSVVVTVVVRLAFCLSLSLFDGGT
jgi:hypothetical protein